MYVPCSDIPLQPDREGNDTLFFCIKSLFESLYLDLFDLIRVMIVVNELLICGFLLFHVRISFLFSLLFITF